MILDLDPAQKKKKGASWFELDDDLDEAWILEHQQFLIEEQRTKVTKKFEKDNEKLKANKEKPMPEKELKERLQAVKELETKFKKENKTKKVEAEGRGASVEKYMKAIEKLDERVKILETQAEDRDGNKEVALGTSKIVSFERPGGGWFRMLTHDRTTSIPVSPSCLRRSLMCQSKSSSPRLSETSSGGPSNRLKTQTTGSSKWNTVLL
jgi:type II secretory pathway component GspD/PulD (secretin)